MMEFQHHILRVREEDGYYYTLTPYAKLIRINKTGAVILELCKTYRNTEELIKAVAEHYQTSPDKVAEETNMFVEQMLKCGILSHSK